VFVLFANCLWSGEWTKGTSMYNANWIERTGRETPPKEATLRDTYQAAQKIAYQLVCASSQLLRVDSPDITDCAALIREALHKPEKDRVRAVKAAELTVLCRQMDYISALAYYLEYAEAWQTMRPTLVAQLEAVAVTEEQPKPHFGPSSPAYLDADLCLNCEAVAALIDECDIAINEANRRRYSSPTQKHAEAGFQKVFDALVAEVTAQNWIFNARMAPRSGHSYDILRDVAVDKVSSTHVPARFVNLNALDVAREEFERAGSWENNRRCREFNQYTRGTFNETQLSESLLAATGDMSSLLYIEEQRDAKLRAWGRSWREVRRLVDHTQACFIKVAELLPAAVAEAAAIEDEQMRRRAQHVCLFAARRLKENIKFVREVDSAVGDRDHNHRDVSAAANRSHALLVARIKSKEIHRPSTKVREEPYYG
jgi:hypothetical protein